MRIKLSWLIVAVGLLALVPTGDKVVKQDGRWQSSKKAIAEETTLAKEETAKALGRLASADYLLTSQVPMIDGSTGVVMGGVGPTGLPDGSVSYPAPDGAVVADATGATGIVSNGVVTDMAKAKTTSGLIKYRAAYAERLAATTGVTPNATPTPTSKTIEPPRQAGFTK